MGVLVHIEFCGIWNHRPKFEHLQVSLKFQHKSPKIQTQILDEFGAEKVTVSGEEVSKKDNPNDPRRGTFKVTVNGTVVHSKKDGDGHVDSDEKVEKIFTAIQKALE